MLGLLTILEEAAGVVVAISVVPLSIVLEAAKPVITVAVAVAVAVVPDADSC
jgi:hypothetical protein